MAQALTESEWPKRGAKRRLLVLWIGIVMGLLILAGRLFYWQVIRHDDLEDLRKRWQLVDRSIPALRGTIEDRSGFPLAMDEYEFEIFATPRDIDDPEGLAAELGPTLGMDQSELVELLSLPEEESVSLAWAAPSEVARAAEKIRDEWDATGLGISPARTRVYPENELACHLLGFVTQDHTTEYPVYYGVEESYDEELRGTTGSWGGAGDVLGLQTDIGLSKLALPQDGRDLVLTVDRTVQQMVEEELLGAIVEYRAASGTIIVMDLGDSRTGAILAMASYPVYDPNLYFEEGTPQELFRNPAVSGVYEPGSVMKVITMAAALDSGVYSRHSTYYDNGRILVGGGLIENYTKRAYGETTMTELLKYSLNVGAATLSTTMGAERFYDYLQRFGLGEATGIDLPQESTGIMRVVGDADWREADLGTNAFGQGIAVTPIQMITAIAAVANDGVLPKPYIVARIEEEDQIINDFQPQPGPRVISAEVARDLTEMLVEAVAGRENLEIPGYAIAGKTGTAEIPVPGGYSQQTIASFVGYAPAYDPQFIILVKLDKPQESSLGAVVAAPVFRRIAERLLIYLGIPPDEIRMASR